MERVQKMGRILACADAWFWPFSRTAHKNEPPGLEIEILQSIAKKHGWDVSIAWVNTGMRFGVGVTSHVHRTGALRHFSRADVHRRRSPHAKHKWNSPRRS